MSVTDWKMKEEWKNEIDWKRRIQNPIFNEIKQSEPLTPIATLKQLKDKKYDEALRKIDFHIKSNFMKYNSVYIYQALLSDDVKIEDTVLHEKIRQQGYSLEIIYSLANVVEKLVIYGW